MQSKLKKLRSASRILIVDLEANPLRDIEDFPRNANEIIEIGAVIVDHKGKIRKEFDMFVKPTYNPNLTPFIKRLTHIDQAQIDNAKIFPQVFHKFIKDFWKQANLFVSWGHFDYYLLLEEFERHKNELKKFGYKEFPIDSRQVINLQDGYHEATGRHAKRLNRTLKAHGIKGFQPPHRAIIDAKNTALITRFLLKQLQN